MGHLMVFTKENWETEVLRSSCVVLVDFRDPFCPFVVVRVDLMERMAVDCGCCVKIGSVDVSRDTELAMTYRIQDRPTMVLFREGRPLKRFTGPDRLREIQVWWLRQENEWKEAEAF